MHVPDNSHNHDDRKLLAALRELVEALDRRVPHIEREGEQQIALDSAALRKTAQARIAELEQAQSNKS